MDLSIWMSATPGTVRVIRRTEGAAYWMPPPATEESLLQGRDGLCGKTKAVLHCG